MRRPWRLCSVFLIVGGCSAQSVIAPAPLTWQEAENEFRANNPTLLAGKNGIDEARADEITAYLRPNPDLNLTADDLGFFTIHPFQPTANAILAGSISYLHEREHKRELRLQSARRATSVAISEQNDLERNLLFTLRDAFVRVLLADAVRTVAKENLDYYEKQVQLNQVRLDAGQMARVDFERIELQRVQYESDLATAEVNLRTAKVDLIQLLGTRVPVDNFSVTEPFDYSEPTVDLEQLRQIALNSRPDLKQSLESLEKSRTDHQLAVANGSSDPTFSFDVGRQPPLVFYAGFSVSLPLRVFDRNQGEKARTAIDITRNERLHLAAEQTALHDVDSAYATLQNALRLLRPYRTTYLKEADDVRSTVSFAYNHGAASLLDFLDAQREFRNTRLSYLNLIGAFLSAANQVNFAVGREVIR